MKSSLDNNNRILSFFTKIDIHYWVLIAVITFVYFLSYSPETTLIGWDSLQVELNPIVNIERNWGSVWQEYQGLGLVAGNAHAVEFLRTIIVFFLTILLPDSFVRYLIHLLYLLVGVLSAYALFKNFGVNRLAAFIGALFYFFNIGTVQNFHVPFEPFSAFYAFFPLLLLMVHKMLANQGVSLKRLLSLSAIFILATFSFQVPTLFIVFTMILAFISIIRLFQLLKMSKHKLDLSRGLVSLSTLWGIYFVVNAFWVLPFLYSLIGNISVRSESISTRLSTENVIYQNLAYANWVDIPLLRGFWYSNIDYQSHIEEFGYMMHPWIAWINNPLVLVVGYVLAVLVLAGVFVSVIYRKAGSYIFIPILILSLFFFFGSAGVTGPLFDLVVKIVPPIGEAFRFAFTKWITPLSLAFSFFFCVFIDYVFIRVKNYSFDRASRWIVSGIAVLLLVFYTWPYFTGNLYYEYNKFDIPDEYSEVISYFNHNVDHQKRIALLPMNSIWGWYFTDWGYRGSGFIWYGLPQAILSRTFDVWSLNNEQFYHEFHYALYSKDSELLKFVLNKYQVDYILLDRNVIAPNADKSLFYEETLSVLSEIDSVSLVSKYNDSIFVYKVEMDEPVEKYVYAPSNFRIAGSTYEFSNVDPAAFSGTTDIYFGEEGYSGVIYPFADDRKLAGFLNTSKELMVTNPGVGRKTLSVPPLNSGNSQLIKAELLNNNVSVKYLFPQIYSRNKLLFSSDESSVYPINVDESTNYSILIGGKIINSETPQIDAYVSLGDEMTVFDERAALLQNVGEQSSSSEFYDCAGATGGKESDIYPNSIRIYSNDKPACVRFPVPIVSGFQQVYKISFEYRVTDGSRIHYCLRDRWTKDCVNQGYADNTQVSDQFSKYTEYVFAGQPHDYVFELILDIDDEAVRSYQASVRNILVETHDVIGAYPLNRLISSNNQGGTLVVEAEDFPLKIVLRDSEAVTVAYKPGSAFYNSGSLNCDQFNQKDYGRIYKDNAYEYYSTDAISCDNIRTEFLDPSSSYLVTFDSKKISGKALDICIAGADLDKCLILDRLNGTGRESYILPAYSSAERISIQISNQSIGDYETRNIFSGLETTAIPYQWLKGITLTDAAIPASSENRVSVRSVEKHSTYKYTVGVIGMDSGTPAKGNGLIVLNQAYEKGWRIYRADKCAFGFKTPFTCGKVENSRHVLARNWANGWVVPAENASYLVVFWPQYLQFAGYLLAIIPAIITGVYVGRHRLRR